MSKRYYPTFSFASPKEKVAKRKGDFFLKAPPKKRGYTLLTQSSTRRYGAVFCLSLLLFNNIKRVCQMFHFGH
jgi:hypothetical protein